MMQEKIILSMLPSDTQMIDTANGDSSFYLSVELLLSEKRDFVVLFAWSPEVKSLSKCDEATKCHFGRFVIGTRLDKLMSF